MISTQISFASFAQAQVAPAHITSQAELDAPKPFKGIFDPRRSLHSAECAGGWRGAFYIDWQASGMLDAPEYLPSGSHHGLDNGEEIVADGFTWRN